MTLLQRLDAKASDPQVDATSRELCKAAAAEIERMRMRAVVGEHRNLVERLGKSSLSQAIEDTLRTKLAEAELALAAMTAERNLLAALLQMLEFEDGDVPTAWPTRERVAAVLGRGLSWVPGKEPRR